MNDCHNYEVFKGYDATDEGLIKFKSDMIKWNEELKDNDILRIDYFKYFTHYISVLMTFKRLCKGKYEDHDTIDSIESKWIEATHNGGLTYCNSGIHNSFGFDFTAFYPTLMGQYKFIIPICHISYASGSYPKYFPIFHKNIRSISSDYHLL
jgi:hypothetical protein